MKKINGSLEIETRTGIKRITYTGSTGDFGVIKLSGFSEPLDARELRITAEKLEIKEKELVKEYIEASFLQEEC